MKYTKYLFLTLMLVSFAACEKKGASDPEIEQGIIEVPAPTSWIGKSLKELNVRAKLGVNIIAIKHGDEVNVSPGADYEIMPGDVMEILGDTKALTAVQKL